MKILAFEYITGGGLNRSELPENLAKEGLLMLQALVTNLSELAMIDLVVILDGRLQGRLADAESAQIHLINAGDDVRQEYLKIISGCDAVWPIAPETGGLLAIYCAEVERAGKILLTSPAGAVKIAGDKLLTYEHLCQRNIKTVPTQKLSEFSFSQGEWMIKSVDGVGCEASFLVNSEADFTNKTVDLDKNLFIVQPHLAGKKTSLSCIFKQGRGWLLCVNLQNFKIHDQRYRLTDINVNINADKASYQPLVNQIAEAMPELWGYAGIDLIETVADVFVLEVNPRLTSSFAGIKQACGLNPAALVLELFSGDPRIEYQQDKMIPIKISD